MSISEEAKARIKEEVNILSNVVDELTQQATEKGIRLSEESIRARELTSQIVATRREEEKQMLASDEAVSHSLCKTSRKDIENIQKMVGNPYFARVLLEEVVLKKTGPNTTRTIEYKLGTTSNIDCRIVDWRKAPIARLYYEYQEGEEYCEYIREQERSGTVLIRNKVEISQSQLQGLTCPLGIFYSKNNEWHSTKRRTSGTRSYGQLPDILSLISPEQYQMITEDADTAILIQGVAGSGKTAVALHRLAWLLHEDNSDLAEHEAVVIVLSPTLNKYISSSLKGLNMKGVATHTFSDWADVTLTKLLGLTNGIKRPKGSNAPGVRRVKTSLALLKCLENYVDDQGTRLAKHLDSILPWEQLGARAKTIHNMLEQRKTAVIPAMIELQDCVDNNTSPQSSNLTSTLELLKSRLLLFKQDLLQILSIPRMIIRADPTNLIDDEVIKSTYEETKQTFEQSCIDDLDEPLLLRLAQLKYGTMFRQIAGVPKYRHVVTDEVQDFAVTQLAVICSLADHPSQLTLAGDIGQQTAKDATFPGWKQLQENWALGDSFSKYVQLTVSHRSTLPIMRLADHVSGKCRTTEGRQGRRPLWFHCTDENDGMKYIIRWLEKIQDLAPGTLAAVVCASPNEAAFAYSLLTPSFGHTVRLADPLDFSFAEGICVTWPELIKGLEFPHVLLWNPSRQSYPSKSLTRNKLYIAITRAEDHLGIVTWGRWSPLLPHVHSKLVRGYDKTEID